MHGLLVAKLGRKIFTFCNIICDGVPTKKKATKPATGALRGFSVPLLPVPQIGSIHRFLIHPGKHSEEPHEVNGTSVPMTGLLFDMLKWVFDQAEEECRHHIAFTADENAPGEGQAIESNSKLTDVFFPVVWDGST